MATSSSSSSDTFVVTSSSNSSSGSVVYVAGMEIQVSSPSAPGVILADFAEAINTASMTVVWADQWTGVGANQNGSVEVAAGPGGSYVYVASSECLPSCSAETTEAITLFKLIASNGDLAWGVANGYTLNGYDLGASAAVVSPDAAYVFVGANLYYNDGYVISSGSVPPDGGFVIQYSSATGAQVAVAGSPDEGCVAPGPDLELNPFAPCNYEDVAALTVGPPVQGDPGVYTVWATGSEGFFEPQSDEAGFGGVVPAQSFAPLPYVQSMEFYDSGDVSVTGINQLVYNNTTPYQSGNNPAMIATNIAYSDGSVYVSGTYKVGNTASNLCSLLYFAAGFAVDISAEVALDPALGEFTAAVASLGLHLAYDSLVGENTFCSWAPPSTVSYLASLSPSLDVNWLEGLVWNPGMPEESEITALAPYALGGVYAAGQAFTGGSIPKAIIVLRIATSGAVADSAVYGSTVSGASSFSDGATYAGNGMFYSLAWESQSPNSYTSTVPSRQSIGSSPSPDSFCCDQGSGGGFPSYTPSNLPSSFTSGLSIALTGFGATIDETGLPAGTYWQSTVYTSSCEAANDCLAADTSSSQATLVALAPGTYDWGVSTPDVAGGCTFSASPASGSFAYVTQAVVDVTYSASGKCTATFDEAGLPTGTSWSVTMDSITKTTTGTSITFTGLSPESYSWTATSPTGYTTAGSGNYNPASLSSYTIAYSPVTSGGRCGGPHIYCI